MDARSTFIKRFGDLIALLRADPGNDAAQDLALTAAAAAVEGQALEVEAGVEWSVIPDDLTLKGRLLARRVELIRVAAGTEPHELLALARALSHDQAPIPVSPNIVVEMVEQLTPPPSTPTPPAPTQAPAPHPRVPPNGGPGTTAATRGTTATRPSTAGAAETGAPPANVGSTSSKDSKPRSRTCRAC